MPARRTLPAGAGRDRDLGFFDSFRNRIIFPTWNLQGDVVGFGARALGDAQPKYLNTAETPADITTKGLAIDRPAALARRIGLWR